MLRKFFSTNPFSKRTIRFAHHPRTYASTIPPIHDKQAIFVTTLTPFANTPCFYFDNANQFTSSWLHQKLSPLFNTYFQVKPYRSHAIQTISMRETLQHLEVEEMYADQIDEEKYLIGIHGASVSSLPSIIPYPSAIKKMSTFHNPFHTENSPVWFFYGDNVRMAMHYSELNSMHTEIINGDSDPLYFPAQVCVLGFANKSLIDKINSEKKETNQEIIVSETIAWGKRPGGLPDEFKIGNEIRIPEVYHSGLSNLLLFGVKGGKRSFPLDQSLQYHEGKPCRWEKGKGYIDLEEEQVTQRNRF